MKLKVQHQQQQDWHNYYLYYKLKNTHINPKDNEKNLDPVSISQICGSYLQQKLISINKGFAGRVF